MNAMTGTNGRPPARGFSLWELLIVVAITLVVAAVAVPQLIAAAQSFKLRSTASGLSGLVQKGRMLAVARNGFYPLLTTTGTMYVFIDVNGTGTMDTTAENTSVLMPGSIAIDPSGSNPSDTALKGSLNPVYASLPRFNPRGLPCFMVSGVCKVDPTQMYITYLRQDRALGATGWAAVTVSPAGRAQVWTWDGSKWQ